MNVIDLFCGIGGLSDGFRKNGFNIILANEIDNEIANSYEKNHPDTIMINDDIKNIIPQIKNLNNKIDVIIGGPPCQGFSMAGARIRTKNSFLDDPRNYLFRNYFNVVQTVEPDFFVMENVPGMLSMKNGQIIEEIERIFSDEDNFHNGKYYVYKKVLNAYDYGVPQTRHRLIIIGSKKPFDFDNVLENVKIKMINEGEIKMHTIRDAISDLAYLESGQGEFKSEYKFPPQCEYQINMRKNSKLLYNHCATRHNEVALKRIKELPQGGRRLDLTDGEEIKSVHSGAYGRMKWEEPAKTIITRFDTPSSGVYIHPTMDRCITPREAARLQSFSDDYIFYGSKSAVIKQIGNAVPPMLSYYLAKVILAIKEDTKNE